jgi:purine-cytosine permease-like protein
MSNTNGHRGKLEWFGGNQDALNMYAAIVDLAQVWDDLIDRDKPVSETTVNHAFLIALVYLQCNPFYRHIQDQILPMWVTSVSSFETANKFEREKDEHGLELAHVLRYAGGHIIAYAIHVCVGEEKAREYVPEMWKTIADERFEAYRKEHTNV